MKNLLHLFSALAISTAIAAEPYNPSQPTESGPTKILDVPVHDTDRHRDLPVRIYLPKNPAPAPVILFSHGLGGSREGNAFMGNHWARRGYVVVFVQHPGSDETVWKGSADPLRSMKKAANFANFSLRLKDIPAVIDQLTLWNTTPGNPLHNRLDLEKIGMAGHSFGALTTQGLSGQSLPWVGVRLTDTRIKAALCLSPSSPEHGNPAKAFATVKIPWMLMTGTNDVSSIGNQTLASRLNIFPALPEGSKYELVLNGANHMTFTDNLIPKSFDNPNHHKTILALSTAFWDACLKDNKEAKTWLDGENALSVLTPADTFQRK